MVSQIQKQIVQWDVRNWSEALNYWEKKTDWDSIYNCLELGGREGGLSLWLALKGKKVICSDIDEVETTASQLHKQFNVSDLISYQEIDATNIPYENHFDLIVFKSILGIIGVNDNASLQQRAIAQIHKALRPGGKLLFAENLCGSGLHQLLRKKFVKWGSSWRYVSLKEINNYLYIFKTYSLKCTGFAGLLGRNEKQRDFLATLDQTLIKFFVPDTWKYIAYGIAEK